MSMITGFWNEIKLICGNHPSETIDDFPEMVIKSGPYSLFYACPKENSDARAEGEIPCYNRINLIDYDKMINHIMDILVNADSEDKKICLKGHKWKDKTREYEIMHHSNDSIIIKMIDYSAIKGHKTFS